MELQVYNKDYLTTKIIEMSKAQNMQEVCNIAASVGIFNDSKKNQELHEFEYMLFFKKTNELFKMHGTTMDTDLFKSFYQQFTKIHSTWTILDYASFCNVVTTGSVVIDGKKVEYKTYGKITFQHLLAFSDTYDEVICEARISRQRKKTSDIFNGKWDDKVVGLLSQMTKKVEVNENKIHKFYKMTTEEIGNYIRLMTDDQLKKEKASTPDTFIQNLIKDEIVRRFENASPPSQN